MRALVIPWDDLVKSIRAIQLPPGILFAPS